MARLLCGYMAMGLCSYMTQGGGGGTPDFK